MNSKTHMIAAAIKEARLARGYTQKELAEMAQVSLRSIQRLENAQLMPRSFTLKTIAAALNIPFERLQTAVTAGQEAAVEPVLQAEGRPGRMQRIVLSIGLPLVLVLFAWAFISQSPRFPETDFEALVFWGFAVLMISGLLLLIWRTKKPPL